MIRVEHHVSVPIRGRKPIYPWRHMEIGDSFEVSKPVADISKLALSAGRTIGARFVCRTVGKGKTRVWRFA